LGLSSSSSGNLAIYAMIAVPYKTAISEWQDLEAWYKKSQVRGASVDELVHQQETTLVLFGQHR